MQTFLKRYPNDPLAVNAAYWVGETYYAQYWSRDPGFAPPDDIGLTDALRFTVLP